MPDCRTRGQTSGSLLRQRNFASGIFSLAAAAILSFPAAATPCATVLGLHGFKAAAQAACDFDQRPNEALEMARVCARSQDQRLNVSQIEFGQASFRKLQEQMGASAACADLFSNFKGIFARKQNSHQPSSSMTIPQSTRNLRAEGLDVDKMTFRGEQGTSFDHNGSEVVVFWKAGLIVYDRPKPALIDVVRRGDLLFEGTLNGPANRAEGRAFVFKAGCAPESYHVAGEAAFEGFGGRNFIVLRGEAPVRAPHSCAVVGTTNRGANTSLRFEFTAGDI